MTPEALTGVPPGLVLIAAGLVLPLIRGTARDTLVLGAPLLTLALVCLLPEAGPTLPWFGQSLQPVAAGPLSRLFAATFTAVAFAGGLYGLRGARTAELSAAFVYAGSAIGVALAGDLLTLFLFWEVMAIGSTVVIWSAGGAAIAAGRRYAVIHAIGGALLMAGLAGHAASGAGLAVAPIGTGTLSGWLILAGLLVNAGAPPLSAWVADAYPEASRSGAVFLSAFTTKAAVYALLRLFPGEPVLIGLGFAAAVYGLVYSAREDDFRRVLAYAIVTQVGVMMVGIGIGTPLALAGAAATAVVHILYKALLMMAAGTVLDLTGERRLSRMGGLAAAIPLTAALAAVGAATMLALPLTAGAAGKPMILDAAAAEGRAWVWYLLTAVSAGAVLQAGAVWIAFFGPARGAGAGPVGRTGLTRPAGAAMILLAVACLAIGLRPGLLLAFVPLPAGGSGDHALAQLQLVGGAAFAFLLVLAGQARARSRTPDLDWFWREGAAGWGRAAGPVRRRLAGLGVVILRLWMRLLHAVYRHLGPDGPLDRSWPTGSMAFWATALLSACLILYYL